MTCVNTRKDSGHHCHHSIKPSSRLKDPTGVGGSVRPSGLLRPWSVQSLQRQFQMNSDFFANGHLGVALRFEELTGAATSAR